MFNFTKERIGILIINYWNWIELYLYIDPRTCHGIAQYLKYD